VFLDAYHSNLNDIVAGIGPSICTEHYEIKDDVAQIVEKTFKKKADEVLTFSKSGIHFNLSKANQIILQESGVSKIENSNICTACDTGKWFSHRAENGATGRFGAYIALP
jgi:copper oxidase (laccase) domain-containing protein